MTAPGTPVTPDERAAEIKAAAEERYKSACEGQHMTADEYAAFDAGWEAGLATHARRLEEARAALGFIESAALFHPDQAWPDEMKEQLRRIGKMAHEALARLSPPPPRREE